MTQEAGHERVAQPVPARGAIDLNRISSADRVAAALGTGLLDTPADEVLEQLAAVAARLTGMPLAFVTVVDERRSYWTSAQGTGIPADDVVSRQNTVDESFCQYVIATDGPVVVTDAATDTLTRDNPSVASMGVRAWAGYPVRGPGGHVVGSFCVVDTAPRLFSPEDLLVLQTLAQSASRELALRSALQAARQRADELLEEQALGRRQNRELDAGLRRLQALNAGALALQQLDDLESVLAACTKHAVEIVGARQGVSSVTRGRSWAQAVAAVELDDTYVRFEDYDVPPDGSGIYAMVCETNTPVRLTQAELEAHPRWRGFGHHAGDHPPLRGWLAAPLVDRTGGNIGLIQLSDKRGHDDGDQAEFDESDLALLVQLAQLASLALEKTVSHQRDHQIAVELQHSLLPPSLPELPGIAMRARYLPGSDDQMVGGDWYDVLPLERGWVGLALGDVVGHGLRSASLMGQMRTALRAYALAEESPAVVVDRLDRLLGSLGSDDMATLAYAVWHPASGRLRLVLAGHPPPFVRAADGTVRPLDAPAGLPLGAFPGGGYTETEHHLPGGSTLLLFSDGLLETRVRAVGEGLDRLVEVLAASPRDLDDLLEGVVAAMTQGRNDDDIALLAVTTAPDA